MQCCQGVEDAACGREPVALDLGEREEKVLSELAREGEASVAFQGLRRRLELHQQALARTLRRLEDRGLVARGDAGYRLTEAGFCAASARAPARDASRAPVALVQALLPASLSPDRVAERLARRWFGDLRWYGRADAPGETTLTWLTPAGLAVRVRILGSSLTLEADADAADPERSYAAARPVLAALAELYVPSAPARGVQAAQAAAGVAG